MAYQCKRCLMFTAYNVSHTCVYADLDELRKENATLRAEITKAKSSLESAIFNLEMIGNSRSFDGEDTAAAELARHTVKKLKGAL